MCLENEPAGDKVCFYTVDTSGRPMSAPTAEVYLSSKTDTHSRHILICFVFFRMTKPTKS